MSQAAASVSPYTTYQYRRYYIRFCRYQMAHPDLPLLDAAQRFLGTLTLTAQPIARNALRFAYPELDWRTVSVQRTARNEIQLEASILTESELERLFAALSPRDRALAALWYVARRTEATRLRWEHIDLTAGTVRVIQGKGGKTSWTLLPERALIHLRAWHDDPTRPENPYVFANRAGQPMNPGALAQHISHQLKRLGLYRPYRGPHAFRRTFANAYNSANPGDTLGLRQLLRHTNLATTALYIFQKPDVIRQRMQHLTL